MTQQEAVNRWRESAKRNLASSKEMYASHHYDWSLFVGQLALEKLLKGLIASKKNDAPPISHNLVLLAHQTEIDLTPQQTDELAAITRFNVEARYETIKEELYKKATPAFTKQWLATIERIFLWIEQQF